MSAGDDSEKSRMSVEIVRNVIFPANLVDECWKWKKDNHSDGRKLAWKFYRSTNDHNRSALSVKLEPDCILNCVNPEHLIGVFPND